MHKLGLFSFLIATSVALPRPQSQQSSDDDFLKYGILGAKNLNIGNDKTFNGYPDFRPFGREEAVPETEYWLSRKDSVYDRAQNTVARILTPKPIVDTIQEHEKYGNDGGVHRKVATAVVNGFDAIGNAFNAIIEKQKSAKDRLSKTIVSALNVVGGKVSGLY